jgi:hypothetical protein
MQADLAFYPPSATASGVSWPPREERAACARTAPHAGAPCEALRPPRLRPQARHRCGGQVPDPAPAVRHQGHDPGRGDDCAAMPDGDGYLLLAIEGLIPTSCSSSPGSPATAA